MKLPLLAIRALMLLGLVTVPVACKRQPHRPPLSSGAVIFEGAGVSLAPGENWKQGRSGDFARSQLGELCLPVLEGEGEFKGGVILVYSSRSVRSDPQTKAASLRKEIEAKPEIIRTSIKQEDFTAESGVRGVHISYNQKVEEKGRKYLTRTHFYIVKNKQQRCVGLSYITLANKDSEAVHQMIRKTLSLH